MTQESTARRYECGETRGVNGEVQQGSVEVLNQKPTSSGKALVSRMKGWSFHVLFLGRRTVLAK